MWKTVVFRGFRDQTPTVFNSSDTNGLDIIDIYLMLTTNRNLGTKKNKKKAELKFCSHILPFLYLQDEESPQLWLVAI